MDVTINRDLLVREFGLARRLGERKSTLPVYSYARLEAEFDGIHVGATDGEAALEMLCEAAAVGEPGVTLVPIRTVHEIARAASADTVRLSTDGDKLLVQSGSFRSRLGVLPVSDFPAVPDTPLGVVQLPTAVLREAIEKTKFVVEASAERSHVNAAFGGTLLKLSKSGIEVVATDGYRIAHVQSNGLSAEPSAALVPRKGFDDLATVLAMDDAPETVGYATADGKAYFVTARRRFVTRLMDAKYPDYARVIPKPGPVSADVDRDAWLAVLRRVRLVSDQQTHRVQLAFSGGAVTASMESATVGAATEALPATVAGDGWETGFDSQYLTDFLAAAGAGTVRLSQATPVAGGLFQSIGGAVEYKYALMPMTK